MWFTTSSACDEVKIDMQKSMANTMVASPQHLNLIFDESFRPLSSKSIDCLYRSIFWMAFVGVPHEHIKELRARDFDLPNRILKYNGVQYTLPEESIRAITDALYLRYFNVNVYAKYRQKKNRIAPVARVKGSRLTRGLRQDGHSVARTEVVAREKMNQAGYELTYQRVTESGALWKILKSSKPGQPPNLDPELQRRMELYTNKTGQVDPEALRNKRNMLRSKIRLQYYDWLATFYEQTDSLHV